MKKGILLLLLLSSVFVKAQSLKDALYSGKLKNEPGAVIRKTDDLASKIDTTTHKPMDDAAPATATLPAADSAAAGATQQTETAAPAATDINDNNTNTAPAAAPVAAAAAPVAAAAPKNNNAILKEYIDSVSSTLKTEVLPSKKIKHGSYFVLVTYAIDTTGQMSITDVSVSPENEYLQQQVKDRVSLDAPKLSPVLSGNGTPRRAIKKYNFTLVKD